MTARPGSRPGSSPGRGRQVLTPARGQSCVPQGPPRLGSPSPPTTAGQRRRPDSAELCPLPWRATRGVSRQADCRDVSAGMPRGAERETRRDTEVHRGRQDAHTEPGWGRRKDINSRGQSKRERTYGTCGRCMSMFDGKQHSSVKRLPFN